jgi:hypothetical protein
MYTKLLSHLCGSSGYCNNTVVVIWYLKELFPNELVWLKAGLYLEPQWHTTKLFIWIFLFFKTKQCMYILEYYTGLPSLVDGEVTLPGL